MSKNESDSTGSSSDSDYSRLESDFESSNTEDQSSATEEATKSIATAQTNPMSAVGGEGDSNDLVLLLIGIAAGKRLTELRLERISKASQSTRESFGFKHRPYSFGNFWSTSQEQSSLPVGNDSSKSMRSSHEQDKKLAQPVARKAPKVTTTKASGLGTAKEEGAHRESQHHSLQKQKRPSLRYFSSSDNSDVSSSEREDGEMFMDTYGAQREPQHHSQQKQRRTSFLHYPSSSDKSSSEREDEEMFVDSTALPESCTKSTTATTNRSNEATLLSPIQHSYQHQQQMGERSNTGNMAGQGVQQSLLRSPGPLVVRLLLMRQPTDPYQQAKVGF